MATVVMGQSPPGSTYNDEGDGVPFFQGKAEFGDLSPTVAKWTTAEKYKEARDGDVLFSVRAPVGPTNLAPGRCAIGRGLAAVRPGPDVTTRYLLWALRASQETLAGRGTGTTFKAISGKVLRSHVIPVAPLDEQRDIVDAIEQLVSHVDRGATTLAGLRPRFDRMRVSTIGSALHGSLGDLSGQSAGPIVDAVREARRQYGEVIHLDNVPPFDVPSEWTWVPLDEIALVASGAAKNKRYEQQEGCVEVPYLSVANVQRGYLDLANVKTMWVKKKKAADLELEPGDVLLNEGGDRDKLGRGWIWEGQLERCIHQNHVFRARLLTDEIDPRWLAHWSNEFGRTWFEKRASQTTGIASINKTVLRSLPVAVPPLDDQRTLLAKLDRALSVVDHLVGEVVISERRSQDLRRSVLAAAFTGQLTTAHVDGVGEETLDGHEAALTEVAS